MHLQFIRFLVFIFLVSFSFSSDFIYAQTPTSQSLNKNTKKAIKASKSKARKSKARKSKSRKSKARKSKARKSKARKSKARKSKARKSKTYQAIYIDNRVWIFIHHRNESIQTYNDIKKYLKSSHISGKKLNLKQIIYWQQRDQINRHKILYNSYLPKPIKRGFKKILKLNNDQIYTSIFSSKKYRQLKNIHIITFHKEEIGNRYLNRIAGYIEKPGRYVGKSIPPLNYHNGFIGHDYGSESLAKFFNQAQKEQAPLRIEEETLLYYLLTQGLIKKSIKGEYLPVAHQALISMVSQVELSRLVLQHELSHAAFFVNKQYRTYCHQFWKKVLTQQERNAFRDWLSKNYHVTDLTYKYQPTLIVNEMQAYLTHSHGGHRGEFWLLTNRPAIEISLKRLEELSRIFEKRSPLKDFFDPVY